MARVTGFTAERMLEIENTTVVDGEINDEGRLLLMQRNGIFLDAGRVTGEKGDPGSGVSDISVTYQMGLSATQAPTGDWLETPPAVPTGAYLWVRTITTYRNPEDATETFQTTSFVVVRQPESGEDGSDGKGVESTEITYQVGNSGVEAPTGTWLIAIPSVLPGRYLWTRTTTKYTDDTSVTAYSVAKQGSDGEPGSSSYIHVAYAENSDGTVGFSKHDPTGKSYMGVYTDHLPVDSDDPAIYIWSKILGNTGVGVAGTSIRYASSTSGTATPLDGWLEVIPAIPEGHFLWTRTVMSFTDGASVTTYTVSKQGVSGSDGLGIYKTTVTYQEGYSGTETPTGTWTSSIPDVGPGGFLWTRTMTEFTDGTQSAAYSVSKIGNTGEDGVGVSSVTIEYQAAISGITPPSGTWSTTIPSVAPGNYLWTRTTTNYTDDTASVGYSVGKSGETGDPGTSVSAVTRFYLLANERPDVPVVVPPPLPWTNTEPAYDPGSLENLYEVTQTIFSNATFTYSAVSLSAAFTAAKIAHQLAAQSNGNIRSDNPASDPENYRANDMWWQYSGIELVAMWMHDGTEWVFQELSDALFRNIDAAKIGTGYLSSERIDAETITVRHLASDVGENLNISSNREIVLSAGRTDDLEEAVDEASRQLAEQRAVFVVTAEGAQVATADRTQYLDMKPGSVALVQDGVEVSKWESGLFYVNEAVFNRARLGNHVFESGETNQTIVRPN